nr:GNAT family N-acetyltransferase [Streptococcus pneumoniae]
MNQVSQLSKLGQSYSRKKVGYLQVKTVAEGSNKDYDRTNDFYRGLGFKKLEIFPQLWNPQNPCQILIKKLE